MNTFKTEVKDLYETISIALRHVRPDSELDRVLKQWEGHRFTVKSGGKWLLGGFIDYFQQALDIMCAVDPSIDPRLPRQSCDPRSIADFFRIPLHELVRPDPKGAPGRKPTMGDVADFAEERRNKRISWTDILAEWRKKHPGDGRKITLNKMQEAFYRKYRRRGKAVRGPLQH